MRITPTLGNDIVDRRDPDNAQSAQNARYARRILSPDEFKLMPRAAQPELWMWAMWAAKEAIFKAISGDGCRIAYNPRAMCVACDDAGVRPSHFADVSGQRVAEGAQCRFEWLWNHNFVHCVVTSRGREPLARAAPLAQFSKDVALSDSEFPSVAVRQLACDHARDCRIVARDAVLKVSPRRTDDRRPEFLSDDRPLDDVLLSLSHDGRFVACALLPQHQREAPAGLSQEPGCRR